MDQEHDTKKTRKWEQLSEKDRYKIEVLLQKGYTPSEIGALCIPSGTDASEKKERPTKVGGLK